MRNSSTLTISIASIATMIIAFALTGSIMLGTAKADTDEQAGNTQTMQNMPHTGSQFQNNTQNNSGHTWNQNGGPNGGQSGDNDVDDQFGHNHNHGGFWQGGQFGGNDWFHHQMMQQWTQMQHYMNWLQFCAYLSNTYGYTPMGIGCPVSVGTI